MTLRMCMLNKLILTILILACTEAILHAEKVYFYSVQDVVVFDTTINSITNDINLEYSKLYYDLLDITPNGKYLYATPYNNATNNIASIVNCETEQLEKTLTFENVKKVGRPYVTPDGDKVYIAAQKTTASNFNTLLILNTASNEVINNIDLQFTVATGDIEHLLAFTKNNQAFIAIHADTPNLISLVNSETGEIINTISLEETKSTGEKVTYYATCLCSTIDGKGAYISAYSGNDLYLIKIIYDSPLRITHKIQIPLPQREYRTTKFSSQIIASPNCDYIFIIPSYTFGNNIEVVNLNTFQYVTALYAGTGPIGGALTYDGLELHIATASNGHAVFDATTLVSKTGPENYYPIFNNDIVVKKHPFVNLPTTFVPYNLLLN